MTPTRTSLALRVLAVVAASTTLGVALHAAGPQLEYGEPSPILANKPLFAATVSALLASVYLVLVLVFQRVARFLWRQMAAHDAGIRITLLDTCYLQAEVTGEPLNGPRRRFDDGTVHEWSQRVAELADDPMTRVGAAIHSVRAVPRDAIPVVAEHARGRGMPLHVHLSEQPAENAACLSAYGVSPTQLLDAEGALGTATTAVHATHLTDEDIWSLGRTGTSISMCCTTERDLADGVGPAVRLAKAGSPLCVGSDGHSVIDLWEEARAIELDERLVTGVRGHLSAEELLVALTEAGARSLGWDSGQVAPGKLADLVTLRLDTPRMAGAATGDPLAHAVFAAGAADVSTVVVGGRVVVDEGVHAMVPRPGQVLGDAIAAVTEGVRA